MGRRPYNVRHWGPLIVLSGLLLAAALGLSTASAEDCNQRPDGPYDEASFVGSASCAECHRQHYDEWQGSAHAYAVVDPLFWAANEESYQVNGVENFCITCHSPPADLTNPEPVAHAVGQADLFPAAQEGVNCETCHRIFDIQHGSKQLSKCEDYYFGPIPDTSGSPHGAEYSDDFEDPDFCKPCHDVNISNATHDGLVQIEFTNTEWDEANAAAGGDADNVVIPTCQECHMPAYTGPAAEGAVDRVVHRHQFVGVDVAIVPMADAHRQHRAVQELAATAASIDTSVEGSDILVEVRNNVIGHSLPTGSAHARAVWVHLRVVGADGVVYLESGDVDANGDLRDEHSEIDPFGDPWISSGESIFRQYMYDENGEEVLAAYGEVRTVERQMLTSGEIRVIRYSLADLADEPAWPVTVEASLLFRPATNFILRALGLPEEQIERVPTFTLATSTLTIDGEG